MKEEFYLNKIERVREDIKKTEAKIREMEDYLKTLQLKERQLCDEEVAKALREMAGKNGDVLETLRRIQQAQSGVYGDHSESREEMSIDA